MEFKNAKKNLFEKYYLYRYVFVTDCEKVNFPQESSACFQLFYKQAN